LFDFDGVLTQPAKVHAAAWKEMFDAYPRERASRTGERFSPSTRASTCEPASAEPSLVTMPARIDTSWRQEGHVPSHQGTRPGIHTTLIVDRDCLLPAV
jgi:beta-phosphoglucomutase-like phosphatase (HAD superfamily)